MHSYECSPNFVDNTHINFLGLRPAVQPIQHRGTIWLAGVINTSNADISPEPGALAAGRFDDDVVSHSSIVGGFAFLKNGRRTVLVLRRPFAKVRLPAPTKSRMQLRVEIAQIVRPVMQLQPVLHEICARLAVGYRCETAKCYLSWPRQSLGMKGYRRGFGLVRIQFT